MPVKHMSDTIDVSDAFSKRTRIFAVGNFDRSPIRCDRPMVRVRSCARRSRGGRREGWTVEPRAFEALHFLRAAADNRRYPVAALRPEAGRLHRAAVTGRQKIPRRDAAYRSVAAKHCLEAAAEHRSNVRQPAIEGRRPCDAADVRYSWQTPDGGEPLSPLQRTVSVESRANLRREEGRRRTQLAPRQRGLPL